MELFLLDRAPRKISASDANWGPAKCLAMKMLAAGADFSDVDEGNRWLVAQGLAM